MSDRWVRKLRAVAVAALAAGLCGCAAAGGGVSAAAGTARSPDADPAPVQDRGDAAERGDTGHPASADRPARPAEGALTAVYRCPGDSAEAIAFVARFEGGETAWVFLPGETVALQRAVAASGARYTDGQTTLWTKGEEALLEWRGARHTGCRNDRRAAVWEHAKLNGVDFRAVGQEPGWHLEIRRADSLVLVSDYGTVRHSFPWTEPVGAAQARRTTYATQAGEDALRVVLTPGPCTDTMSGEEFETEVNVWLNGRQLRGCGRALH